MTMVLSGAVRIARRFQKSVRLDTDINAPHALSGFICHQSGQAVLETMAQLMLESGQRAFTWTGPYGGGKSSLALALASYVTPDLKQRRQARAVLKSVAGLSKVFPASHKDWVVLPVMGRRADPVQEIADIVDATLPKGKKKTGKKSKSVGVDGRALIKRLQEEAEARPKGGVLLVIDEMGKFLEGAASEGADIHFFQELAEAAGRCSGRLIILGVLHQAFEQYAARLGNEARDEWAKVQGRYSDIPVITAIDEVIDLLNQAIVTDINHKKSAAAAGAVAKAIKRRRPGSPDDLAERLDGCWPLHPVTAALLGPLSRRRFGQNERSTFGFLSSSEPEGMQEFLRSEAVSETAIYEPAKLWDYLTVNLEPAILASPDGHRWAQGAEAIERTEAKGSPLHVRLAKTIALIDLFRNGSGIMPDKAVLQACLPGVTRQKTEKALQELEDWSIIVFRKHLDAWAIYAGSDFDIDEAVGAAKASISGLDLDRLSKLADLHPVIAKQHYYRTGTLRWFQTELQTLDKAEQVLKNFKAPKGAAGGFVLAVPESEKGPRAVQEACRRASNNQSLYPVAVGLPGNAWLIKELGAELVALEKVRRDSPELEGDPVARREITARIAATLSELEEELRTSFTQAKWFVGGKVMEGSGKTTLSQIASTLADETFPVGPTIHSELVNREKPSSNSQAAVRSLLYAMVEHANKDHLGIEGFPAERGLYSTILEAAKLHGAQSDGSYGFAAPVEGGPGSSFLPMWQRAEKVLTENDGIVPLSTLYEMWGKPPFGIRRGLMPILAIAFMLANRATLAVYAQEVFRPELDSYVVDILMQGEKLIGLRRVAFEAKNKKILHSTATALKTVTGRKVNIEPLDVARGLVHFIFGLPEWTRRTSALSDSTAALRSVLLTAEDPHRALFVDIPVLFEKDKKAAVGSHIKKCLKELAGAYPDMLDRLRSSMLEALGSEKNRLDALQKRARIVSGLSGDFRLDAFASRLSEFDASDEAMESIAGLAINKPPRDWTDRDPDRAALALAELALKFRQAETFARVKGREPHQHAMAVVFGTGETGRTVIESFDISDDERDQVRALSGTLKKLLGKAGADRRIVLAALAEAGAEALEEELPQGDLKKKQAVAS